MTGIYMFTNRCNGKSYIGQSVNIERRYKNHRFHSGENTLFHDELKYYGFHNFDFCVLEECLVSELNDREIHYIREYNTLFPNGYNVSPGGSMPHVNALKSLDDVQKIIALLCENELSNVQIGEIFGISDQMVSDINCGRCWRQDNLAYPIRDGRRRRNVLPIEKCVICGAPLYNRTKTHMCRKCYDSKRAANYIKKRNNPNGCVVSDDNLNVQNDTIINKLSPIPPVDTLIKKLEEGSFESVAREYRVTSNAIRKWCDKYGISRHSKDYKSNY